jgi:hypothetical protein
MKGKISEWKPILTGIPQGVVVAPLLYNICVADIPRSSGIEISHFSDETAAYT